MPQNPPKILLKLFRWFCHPHLRIPIEGDLRELYEERVQTHGRLKADIYFAKDVIMLFRRDIMRPAGGSYRLNHFGLLRNYFKIGFRNLYRRKGFSLINLSGLSIGLTSCLLLLLYVQNELSFDQFFEDNDRIFKMVGVADDHELSYRSSTPYSFVKTMKNEFAEVEEATAVSGPYGNQRVQVLSESGEKLNFLESGVLLADSSFFDVFSFEMLQGNRNTALSKPNSVVLTESTAKRYYGDRNPLGQFISAAGKQSIVTGVCQDPPANSHITFSYLVSSTSVEWFSQANFNLRKAHCYYKLKAGSSVSLLENKLPTMVNAYVGSEIERVHRVSWEEYQKTSSDFNFRLLPLASLYLDSRVSKAMKPGGNRTMLNILIGIALLIFLLACINFINLSTARSLERAKEVGIRKVLGSAKIQLIVQFLTESFLLTAMSLTIAIISTIILLPYFNVVFDTSLTFTVDQSLLIYGLFILVVIALLAGLYPAFAISSSSTLSSLKGNSHSGIKTNSLKNGLIVFQFWIAFALITGTLIVRQQINYLTEKNLGYDKDQLLVIEGLFDKDPSFSQPFLASLNTVPGVKESAPTLWVQGFGGTWNDEYRKAGSDKIVSVNRVPIGDGLAELMNFQLVDGKLFSGATNDSLFVLVNESAVSLLGFSEPVGKKILQVRHDNGLLKEVPFMIKGVIKDFNYHSLHERIEPLVLQSTDHIYGRMSYIVTKINPDNMRETLAQIEEKWHSTIRNRPFAFRFLDEVVDSKYKGENRLRDLLLFFSALSILIAGIGLIGLSVYAINLRRKEISIRKVIGASLGQLLILLSSGFLRLILLSFVLAIPATWLLAGKWLEKFAYRIDIDPFTFLIAGVMVILPAWIILGILSVKTAIANPAESLKDE
ncbi:MAG: ABC transporter permease [Cyclobacteriaceae bacterium]